MIEMSFVTSDVGFTSVKIMKMIKCKFPFCSHVQNLPQNNSATVEGRLAEVIKSCIEVEKKNTIWVNSEGTKLVVYLLDL